MATTTAAKTADVVREIARLEAMTVKRLKARYAEVFGEEARGNNRRWLVRRIAWRLQAMAEGDLTERRGAGRPNGPGRRHPGRTAPDALPDGAGADARTETRPARLRGDGRLPPPGTVLTRSYKGGVVRVKVLADGFEFDGRVRVAQPAAKAATGSHCNGFAFFGLDKKETDR